jgi:hypothetical protein
MPTTLLLAPPDFQTFRHSSLLSRGYKYQRLEPNLHVLAERARMAASCLHLPSKSHCGIAKNFAQANSLQKINVKTVIRIQKDFFMYYSYVYTNRVCLPNFCPCLLHYLSRTRQEELRRAFPEAFLALSPPLEPDLNFFFQNIKNLKVHFP